MARNVLLSCFFIGALLFHPHSTVQPADAYAGENFTAEQLIANHLQSLGKPEALMNAQSRGFVGTSSFEVILGGIGRYPYGLAMFASEGRKLGIAMSYQNAEYPGEYFAFDGKEVSVSHIRPGVKSPLAQFLYRFDDVMKEGLLGGALSASWPLLNIREKQPRVLKYGVRKIDGRRLHKLVYRPRDGLGNMKIELYFDWETFRHVRTEYLVRILNDLSLPPASLSIMEVVPEYRYHLIEEFDKFGSVGGIVLPQNYSLHYTVEGQNFTFIGLWKLRAGGWVLNKSYDERVFQAEK
jgi:hypothetical protein